MRIERIQLFTLDELLPKARAHAIETWRMEDIDYDWAADLLADLVATVVNPMGWRINKSFNGKENCIYWSGFDTRDEGLSFAGEWNSEWLSCDSIKKDWPRESLLWDIYSNYHFMARSYAIDNEGAYLSGTSTAANGYCNAMNTEFVLDNAVCHRSAPFAENTRQLMNWMFKQLKAEYEYRNSDEAIAETILDNDYEFTINGVMFDKRQFFVQPT